ncbi:MAG: hypothetical protein ABFS56_04525 [Pseudomonadota bacterium]
MFWKPGRSSFGGVIILALIQPRPFYRLGTLGNATLARLSVPILLLFRPAREVSQHIHFSPRHEWFLMAGNHKGMPLRILPDAAARCL